MTHSILLLSILVFSFSCEKNQTGLKNYALEIESENDLINIEPVRLSGSDVLISDRLQTTKSLLVVDTILIAERMVAAPAYYEFFNLKDGTHLASFGKNGGGPIEFPDFTRANIIDKKARILGISVPNDEGAYYEVSIDSIIGNNVSSLKKVFNFGYKYNGQYTRLNDMSFAILSSNTEKRIAIIDQTGKPIAEKVDYPFLNQLDLPNDLLGLAYQADIVKNDQLNRIGIFNAESPNWDIIEFKGSEVEKSYFNHIRPPSVRNDSYSEGNITTRAVAIYADSKTSFLSTVSNDKAIYSLYSGKSFEAYELNSLISKVVLVFDWEGNVIGKFELQQDATSIAVSEDNTTLYAYVETPTENKVMAYSIPE